MAGIPFRISRPVYFVYSKTTTTEPKEKTYEIGVEYKTDESAVYWANVDPALFKSSDHTVVFRDPATNGGSGGALASLQSDGLDKSKGFITAIGSFAAAALSIYVAQTAKTPGLEAAADASAVGFFSQGILASYEGLRADQRDAELRRLGLGPTTTSSLTGVGVMDAPALAQAIGRRNGLESTSDGPIPTAIRKQADLARTAGETFAKKVFAPTVDASTSPPTPVEPLVKRLPREELKTLAADVKKVLVNLSDASQHEEILSTPSGGSKARVLAEIERCEALVTAERGKPDGGAEPMKSLFAAIDEAMTSARSIAIALIVFKVVESDSMFRASWKPQLVAELKRQLDLLEARDNLDVGATSADPLSRSDDYIDVEKRLYRAVGMSEDWRQLDALQRMLRSSPYRLEDGWGRGEERSGMSQYDAARTTITAIRAKFDTAIAVFVQAESITKPATGASVAPAVAPPTPPLPWEKHADRTEVRAFERYECDPSAPRPNGASWALRRLVESGDIANVQPGDIVLVVEPGYHVPPPRDRAKDTSPPITLPKGGGGR